jgi:hypothetical protein
VDYGNGKLTGTGCHLRSQRVLIEFVEVKVVLKPPRKATLIIEARGVAARKSHLACLVASLLLVDSSGKEGLKQSLSLGATISFL